MKVSIRNEQDKLKVTKEMRDTVKLAAKASLDFMNFGTKFEISVMFTDDENIRVLNKLHRNIDRSTDVLSFPMFDYDENGEIIEDYADFNRNGEMLLGDIVISLEHAKAQAEEYGHALLREIGFLTVHSMLHLFGYDHMTKEDEKEMFSYQEEILNGMGLTR